MTGEELIILSGNLIKNNIITWTALPLSYDSISYLDLLRDILARPIFTSLLMWIRWIVCLCIVFKKANRQRREALIPVRNIRIIFQISWMKKAFWFVLLTPIFFLILSLLAFFLNNNGTDISILIRIISWICWILCIISFILSIILPFKLAKKFSQPAIFWLWILFVYPIFIGILAFDKECIYTEHNIENKDFESKNLLK